MLFENDTLKVRQLQKKDNHILAKWLSDPEVLEFYGGRDNPFDIEKVNQKFYNCEDEVVRCIVGFQGIQIAYIQYYQLDEEYRGIYGYDATENIYGIDQFIGTTKYWNKGIGTLLVRSMIDFLIKQKQADRIVMDPQTRNKRAIRCYEKCNFKKIKLLPKHEWHEGAYRDCWMLEYSKPSG